MSEQTDMQVITLLQSGVESKENQGIKILYEQNFKLIEHLVVTNKGSSTDAEDLFQEGIIVLYKQLRKPDFGLDCKIKTYLYSVCRNLWLKRLRTFGRTTELTETYNAVPIDETSLQKIEITERTKSLMDLLETIGESCKKMLLFYYFEQLKMKEIAEKMDLANEQVAKNKKSICMRKLKAIVKDSPHYKEIFR